MRWGAKPKAVHNPAASPPGRLYNPPPPNCPLSPTTQAIRIWLLTLPATLHAYVDQLTSPGGLLLHWDEKMLSEAGVKNAFHRKQLLAYCQTLQQVQCAVLLC